jgi:hypothetical protein
MAGLVSFLFSPMAAAAMKAIINARPPAEVTDMPLIKLSPEQIHIAGLCTEFNDQWGQFWTISHDRPSKALITSSQAALWFQMFARVQEIVTSAAQAEATLRQCVSEAGKYGTANSIDALNAYIGDMKVSQWILDQYAVIISTTSTTATISTAPPQLLYAPSIVAAPTLPTSFSAPMPMKRRRVKSGVASLVEWYATPSAMPQPPPVAAPVRAPAAPNTVNKVRCRRDIPNTTMLGASVLSTAPKEVRRAIPRNQRAKHVIPVAPEPSFSDGSYSSVSENEVYSDEESGDDFSDDSASIEKIPSSHKRAPLSPLPAATKRHHKHHTPPPPPPKDGETPMEDDDGWLAGTGPK